MRRSWLRRAIEPSTEPRGRSLRASRTSDAGSASAALSSKSAFLVGARPSPRNGGARFANMSVKDGSSQGPPRLAHYNLKMGIRIYGRDGAECTTEATPRLRRHARQAGTDRRPRTSRSHTCTDESPPTAAASVAPWSIRQSPSTHVATVVAAARGKRTHAAWQGGRRWVSAETHREDAFTTQSRDARHNNCKK